MNIIGCDGELPWSGKLFWKGKCCKVYFHLVLLTVPLSWHFPECQRWKWIFRWHGTVIAHEVTSDSSVNWTYAGEVAQTRRCCERCWGRCGEWSWWEWRPRRWRQRRQRSPNIATSSARAQRKHIAVAIKWNQFRVAYRWWYFAQVNCWAPFTLWNDFFSLHTIPPASFVSRACDELVFFLRSMFRGNCKELPLMVTPGYGRAFFLFLPILSDNTKQVALFARSLCGIMARKWISLGVVSLKFLAQVAINFSTILCKYQPTHDYWRCFIHQKSPFNPTPSLSSFFFLNKRNNHAFSALKVLQNIQCWIIEGADVPMKEKLESQWESG